MQYGNIIQFCRIPAGIKTKERGQVSVVKKTSRISLTIILMMVFTLVMITTAYAGSGGAEVYVNNTRLSASKPYWKNRNAPASASDWNAHFDAETATLTLKNAVMDTAYATPEGDTLVRASGALNLVPEGTNTLHRTGSQEGSTFGVYSADDLTIRGSGTLDILAKDSVSTGTIAAIATNGNLTVQSGTLIPEAECGAEAETVAIMCIQRMIFSGGDDCFLCAGSSRADHDEKEILLIC